MSSPAGSESLRVEVAESRLENRIEVQSVHLPTAEVLLVGSDAAERSTLRSILAPLGYRMVDAVSGADARHCVSTRTFAVILLDVRAWSCDGFEIAAFVRSRETSMPTPIIFVTTIDRAEQEMAVGYAMGAVDFIVAPIVPAALRGKVALFADLFAKTRELVDHAARLRHAASNSAEALTFQLEMLDRLERLGRAKSDFLSKISHELRSPLTSVIGYVELLIDGGAGEPSAEQKRMLAIIDRNGRRLLALIEDLLTMSRVDAGTFELDVGSVNLHEMIDRVRETTAPAIAKAELQLIVSLGRSSQLIGDDDQLERALLNLVSNAVKFTAPGGQVEISTRSEGDEIAISVRDTGSGIPADEQEYLFTRFFRSTRSKEQQVAGTGLGLYIVKQIIELHGGAIDVGSTPAGSTFTMRVPIGGPPADPLALVRRA